MFYHMEICFGGSSNLEKTNCYFLSRFQQVIDQPILVDIILAEMFDAMSSVVARISDPKIKMKTKPLPFFVYLLDGLNHQGRSCESFCEDTFDNRLMNWFCPLTFNCSTDNNCRAANYDTDTWNTRKSRVNVSFVYIQCWTIFAGRSWNIANED